MKVNHASASDICRGTYILADYTQGKTQSFLPFTGSQWQAHIALCRAANTSTIKTITPTAPISPANHNFFHLLFAVLIEGDKKRSQ